MNCEIIKDLLPLYVDNVCSAETKREVEKHLASCAECRALYESMKQDLQAPKDDLPVPKEKIIYLRTRQHIGNFLIFCLLVLAFVLIAFGALNEIGEHGWPQGIFAVTVVIPGTALALAVLNFFFFRQYSTPKRFCFASAAIAGVGCLIGDTLALFHYHAPENWVRILPFCLLIAAVVTTAEYFAARLYCRFLE